MAQKTISIGIPSLSKPTPMGLRYVMRGLLWLSAAWAMTSPVITEISPESLAIVNKYLLLLNGLVNMSIKFFGVNIEPEYKPMDNE